MMSRIKLRSGKTVIALTTLALLASAAWIRCGPVDPALLDSTGARSITVTDRHGVVLYETRSAFGTRSERIAPDDIPPIVAKATLAAEDRRFLSHVGIDPVAVVRATWRNLREVRIAEGGSTITQQVAKRLQIRSGERDGKRARLRSKLAEAVLALRLEHRYSKAAILAMYLELAPYGNQYEGIARASRGYFGVPPQSLTIAQAALLAGLPQQPSTLNPYRAPNAAIRRQHVVISRMEAAGVIAAGEAAGARKEKLRLLAQAYPFGAPHFTQRVIASLPAGATRIITTLDSRLQSEIGIILKTHGNMLRKHGAANVAVAVLDHQNGEWLAWEGSGDYATGHEGTIDGVVAARQPGSALKPFTYALAFEHGFDPASLLADVPMSFPTAVSGIVYTPRNYDDRFRGPMRARVALAGSENVPAVSLLATLKPPALLRLLRAFGFTTFDRTAEHYGLGLTLGDGEVRLDELVAAYGVLAKGGVRAAPRMIREFTGSGGRMTTAGPATGTRVLSAESAFWVTGILSDNEARSFAFGRGGDLELPFQAAVKTGTSQAFRDNWCVGYSSRFTVGVWVGNFDGRSLRSSSGVTGAAPIFHDVLLAAERLASGGVPEETAPAILNPPVTLAERNICGLSGLAATTACPSIRSEWLRRGTRPVCEWHHRICSGRNCESQETVTIYPPQFRTWAPATAPGRAASVAEQRRRTTPPAAIAIANPADGATYLLDPTLRSSFQTIRLRASGGASGPITWSVDGTILAKNAAPTSAVRWEAVRGTHQVRARDARGSEATATVTVR